MYRKGDFVLASGEKSRYYFNTKSITFSPEGAFLVAKAFIGKITTEKIDGVGGLEIGSIPITGSLCILCYQEELDFSFFVVRKRTKQHGERRQVEGSKIDKISNVIIIDDVTTTGNSVVQTVDAVNSLGWNVKKIITLIDRKEGGQELLSERNIPFDSIFSIEDF